MRLILYSKPGCHLCEGLQEKLAQIKTFICELEIRDITTDKNWFALY
ncbi:MAG: glutaredoxin family protein, partial [Dolichospermum sp.]